MNDNIDKNLVLRQLMTYGAIVGTLLIVYAILMYVSGVNIFVANEDSSFLESLRPLIYGLGIFYSVRHLSLKVLNKDFSFKQFFVYGSLVGVFSSILTATYFTVFLLYISPGTLSIILEATTEMYAGLDVAFDADTMMNFMQQPILLFFIQLFGDILFAVFYSFIFAILYSFTKKLTKRND